MVQGGRPIIVLDTMVITGRDIMVIMDRDSIILISDLGITLIMDMDMDMDMDRGDERYWNLNYQYFLNIKCIKPVSNPFMGISSLSLFFASRSRADFSPLFLIATYINGLKSALQKGS